MQSRNVLARVAESDDAVIDVVTVWKISDLEVVNLSDYHRAKGTTVTFWQVCFC